MMKFEIRMKFEARMFEGVQHGKRVWRRRAGKGE